MKKHLFLNIDYHSTVKLSAADKKKMGRWSQEASDTVEFLFRKGILPRKEFRSVKTLHVSLMLCGEKRIRMLNREHRGKDKVTDVLSFPAHENLRGSGYKGTDLFLGDMAICHGVAKRQAKEFKIGYWDEFIHLFFHGLIHLMGYDHEISEAEKKLMEKWEKIGLDKLTEFKRAQ